MKYLTLSLIVFGFSSLASAANLYSNNEEMNSESRSAEKWMFAATGVFLQDSGTNGANDFLNSIHVGTSSTLKNVNLGRKLALSLEASYLISEALNDVHVNYFHFNHDSTASTTAPIGGVIGSNILNLNMTTGYALDQADFGIGQFIQVNPRLFFHPWLGFRWSNIKHIYQGNFIQQNQNPAFPNGTVSFFEKSEFNGVGPLVGFDTYYDMNKGFGMIGHVKVASLVGSLAANSTASSLNFINPVTPVAINGAFKTDPIHRIIPVMDIKLGLDYINYFNFHNTQKSTIALEIGYQVSNYFNAVDRIAVSAEGTIGGRSTSGMFLDGIYTTLIFQV